MSTQDDRKLREMLQHCKEEHRVLDDKIQVLLETEIVDQLEVSRLKRKKLSFKDQITQIECKLLPDIIA